MKVGQRVQIMSGMREFVGKTGTYHGDFEKDGSTKLYRIVLDQPVMVPGVGFVGNDLWSKDHLQNVRRGN